MQAYKPIHLGMFLFLFVCGICPEVILADINIYPDSLAFDNVGYYNGDIHSNGEELVMKEIVKPSMCVFDVGANIGEWSTKVLQLAPTAQLYVFEPIPVVFNALKENVRLGNIFNMAFSNVQGTSEFDYYPGHSVMSGLFARPCLLEILHEKPQMIKVPTDTLDNFCKEHDIELIDFLKIDTEGAEVAILQGAEQLLRNQKIKYIQFEYGGCYSDAGTTLQEAYRLLSSCNYDVYRIMSNGIIHITEWRDVLENYRYSNYLAVAR